MWQLTTDLIKAKEGIKKLTHIIASKLPYGETEPHANPLRQLSLKIHYIKFGITVPPCKLYIKNLTLKITMRPYNSVQMSIPC